MNRVKLLKFCCRTGLFAALSLASCTNAATHWSRNGTGDAIRDADYRSCRNDSRTSSNARVDQDLLASSAARSVGGVPPTEAPSSFTSRDSDQASSALITCMTDKGYRGY